jgi:conjugative transfer signal peptidase TraF
MSKLKPLWQAGLVALVAFALISVYSARVPYSLVWNTTESIPKGLYFSEDAVPSNSWKYGDTGCFTYQAPEWAQPRSYFPKNFRLCKYVVGFEGDTLTVENDEMWVNQRTGARLSLGSFAEVDSKGRPLPKGLVAGPIPAGQVVMSAPTFVNSMDSRYLGPIQKSALRNRIHPLITW